MCPQLLLALGENPSLQVIRLCSTSRQAGSSATRPETLLVEYAHVMQTLLNRECLIPPHILLIAQILAEPHSIVALSLGKDSMKDGNLREIAPVQGAGSSHQPARSKLRPIGDPHAH
jgi:hypothetical protein